MAPLSRAPAAGALPSGAAAPRAVSQSVLRRLALRCDGRARHIGDDRAMIGALSTTDVEMQKAKLRARENAIDAHPGTNGRNRGKGVAKAAACFVERVLKVAQVVPLQSTQDRQVQVPRDQNRMLGLARGIDEAMDLLLAQLRV